MNFYLRLSEALYLSLLVLVAGEEDTGNSSYWPELITAVAHTCVSAGALLQLVNGPPPVLGRLARDVIPLHYTLELIPSYQHRVFSGHEVVLVKVINATKNIFLHSRGLQLDEASLSLADQLTGHKVMVSSLEEEKHNQWVVITLATELQEGKQYILEIHFRGLITGQPSCGLQGHNYNETQNGWLLITQFEPNNARSVFPCFDEPGFRAPFNISIATPPGMHALSNMPLREATETVVELPGWVWSRFEQSIPMPTYLVGFVVSNFQSVKGNGNFSVWLQQGRESQATLMVHFGPLMLAALEDYTEQPFMLPKQDNVPIPSLASAGAMATAGTETWGLISLKGTAVIFNELDVTYMRKCKMLQILAHELAHNWFGNLVSLKYWDELWLKEGFASFLQYHITSMVMPTWELESDFQISIMQSSLILVDSTALNQAAGTQEEILAKYNIRTYNTGAAIIHMFQHMLTPETFLTGVRQYLKTYAYQSASSQQLFEVVDAVAVNDSSQTLPPGIRVGEVMRPWLYQAHYPLITVTRDYSLGTVTVCQTDAGGENHTWWVPLSYTSQTEANFNNTKPRLWLAPNETCTNLTEPLAAHEWIIFNIQQTGYYRVNYDDRNWQLLAAFLDSEEYHKIHVLNRAQLLDDVHNVGRARATENIIKYLKRETRPSPWIAALNGAFFDSMNDSLVEELLDVFHKLVPLNAPFKDPPQLWEKALDTSCFFSKCEEVSYNLLKSLQTNRTSYSLTPGVSLIIICPALRHDNITRKDVLFLWKLIQDLKDHEELVSALTSCLVPNKVVHSLMVAIVIDGSWLTSKEQKHLLDYVCQFPGKISGLKEVLTTLEKRNGRTMKLYLLRAITTVIGSTSRRSTIPQAWCSLAMSWLINSEDSLAGFFI